MLSKKPCGIRVLKSYLHQLRTIFHIAEPHKCVDIFSINTKEGQESCINKIYVNTNYTIFSNSTFLDNIAVNNIQFSQKIINIRFI